MKARYLLTLVLLVICANAVFADYSLNPKAAGMGSYALMPQSNGYADRSNGVPWGTKLSHYDPRSTFTKGETVYFIVSFKTGNKYSVSAGIKVCLPDEDPETANGVGSGSCTYAKHETDGDWRYSLGGWGTSDQNVGNYEAFAKGSDDAEYVTSCLVTIRDDYYFSGTPCVHDPDGHDNEDRGDQTEFVFETDESASSVVVTVGSPVMTVPLTLVFDRPGDFLQHKWEGHLDIERLSPGWHTATATYIVDVDGSSVTKTAQCQVAVVRAGEVSYTGNTECYETTLNCTLKLVPDAPSVKNFFDGHVAWDTRSPAYPATESGVTTEQAVTVQRPIESISAYIDGDVNTSMALATCDITPLNASWVAATDPDEQLDSCDDGNDDGVSADAMKSKVESVLAFAQWIDGWGRGQDGIDNFSVDWENGNRPSSVTHQRRDCCDNGEIKVDMKRTENYSLKITTPTPKKIMLPGLSVDAEVGFGSVPGVYNISATIKGGAFIEFGNEYTVPFTYTREKSGCSDSDCETIEWGPHFSFNVGAALTIEACATVFNFGGCAIAGAEASGTVSLAGTLKKEECASDSGWQNSIAANWGNLRLAYNMTVQEAGTSGGTIYSSSGSVSLSNNNTAP